MNSDEENTTELYIEQNIINNIKQYYNLYDRNVEDTNTITLLNNVMETYKEKIKSPYNIDIFVNIIKGLKNRQLYKLLITFMEQNINCIRIGSLFDAFMCIIYSGLSMSYDNIDVNNVIITKLLGSVEMHSEQYFNKLNNIDILPNKIKILLKISKIDIRGLKLLLSTGAIKQSHFTFFENSQDSFEKFCYMVHTNYFADNEYFNEQLFELKKYDNDNYNKYYADCKYFLDNL